MLAARLQCSVKLPDEVDIIWNHTRVCGWPCKVCCVAAIQVRGSAMMSANLKRSEKLTRLPGENKFAAGQRVLQARGDELTFEQKLQVLSHLEGIKAKIDISGGDALITGDGLRLLVACSDKLGKENVTLTITGAGLGAHRAEEVAPLIGEFNFTYNAASPDDAVVRPDEYAVGNLKLARKMKVLGVTARAEFPLTKEVITPDHLERLYVNLADAGIDKLLVMRQFPVGRGEFFPEHVPTREEYLRAIIVLRQLEARIKGPRVKLQCALQLAEMQAGLVPRSSANPCDLGRVSYGLMADGTLLASPWAMNSHGRPLHAAWVLGNLAKTRLTELLATEKAQTFIARGDDNHGQCKIFAYQHSKRADHVERIFDKTDPLYDPTMSPVMVAAE